MSILSSSSMNCTALLCVASERISAMSHIEFSPISRLWLSPVKVTSPPEILTDVPIFVEAPSNFVLKILSFVAISSKPLVSNMELSGQFDLKVIEFSIASPVFPTITISAR